MEGPGGQARGGPQTQNWGTAGSPDAHRRFPGGSCGNAGGFLGCPGPGSYEHPGKTGGGLRHKRLARHLMVLPEELSHLQPKFQMPFTTGKSVSSEQQLEPKLH